MKNAQNDFLFVYANAFFADNIQNCKSSKKYLIKLFSGPIAQKTNKQNLIITLFTKTELLAISQTAKNIIYLLFSKIAT